MPKPLHILYICHDGDLYGSQQSLLLLLENLPQSTYQLSVSIARPGPLQERLTKLPNIYRVLSHRRLQWVKHDRRTFLQRVGDLLGLLIGLLPRSTALATQIRREGIQLVHTNSMVSLEGVLAARLAGVPHCWHIREIFMKENPKLHMVLGRSLTRWIINRLSDRVICISSAVQQQFQPIQDSAKYPVLYNALALEESGSLPTAPSEDTSWRIGYIGRLSAGKRFQDLLDAFYRLKQAVNRPVELLVAGNFVDEAFRQQITAQIQALQLQDAVKLLGYQEDLSEIYRQLHVLVVPSLHEPFGRVIIEAMRVGIPCIATRSGGIPEIVTDRETGFLYPPKDSVALASLLQEVLDSPELRATVREQAYRMIQERFSIKTQIDSLEAIYKQMLPKKP